MNNYRDEFIKIAKELAGAMQKEDKVPKVDYKEFNSQIKKEDRKSIPIYSGCISYFPDALKEVSKCSLAGQKQHNQGNKLYWDKEKSTDNADAMVRHLIDHENNPIDDDGVLHLAKVAWRALAVLQIYLDKK